MSYLHVVLKGCFLSPGEETLSSELVRPVVTKTCRMQPRKSLHMHVLSAFDLQADEWRSSMHQNSSRPLMRHTRDNCGPRSTKFEKLETGCICSTQTACAPGAVVGMACCQSTGS